VLILIMLAIVLALLKRRRGSRVMLALALIGFLAVACGPVPAWLLEHLQAPYAANAPVTWGQRNAIVLLGAGTVRLPHDGAVEASLMAYGRIDKAAALYHDCRAAGHECRVEVSGGDARGTGRSEAAVYADALGALGVDASDLMREGRSMNTWQNAQFSAALLKSFAPDRVLLVSSGFHLRRGTLYFDHFGLDAVPERADYASAELSWWPLSYNIAMADLAAHEYVGVWQYHWYNLMGWNAKAVRPRALQ
jgi:uncharacterized SAM-binding protein YcdF (DUF218 family)